MPATSAGPAEKMKDVCRALVIDVGCDAYRLMIKSGTRLFVRGPRPLGAGDMGGEVYRAKDTRLERNPRQKPPTT